MEMTVRQAEGKTPVTVLQTSGDIDRTNYTDLIAKAEELFKGGTRDLLLDMSGTDYISTAGLMALHTIARIMRGEGAPDSDSWDALHDMDRQRDSGFQPHFKLVNVQPRVDKSLETVGFKGYIQCFSSEKEALAAF
jgi:anti-anti-sigma regulatory factor